MSKTIMEKAIKKRVEELETEIKKHEEVYANLPTIIVSKQGAVLELSKLLESKKET